MAKEIMDREASDNEYLHRDFHISMNVGLEFLRENYGNDGVIDYLEKFAENYYSPLTTGLKDLGLSVLRDHIKNIYDVEKADVNIDFTEDEMIVKIEECPALKHFNRMNVKPSPMYVHTTKTVYETICKGTPFVFELIEYDEKTGKSIQRFYRRCCK